MYVNYRIYDNFDLCKEGGLDIPTKVRLVIYCSNLRFVSKYCW